MYMFYANNILLFLIFTKNKQKFYCIYINYIILILKIIINNNF